MKFVFFETVIRDSINDQVSIAIARWRAKLFYQEYSSYKIGC